MWKTESEQPLASAYVLHLSYFGSGLGDLSGLEPPESGKICHCQYQTRLLVLVNFQVQASIV